MNLNHIHSLHKNSANTGPIFLGIFFAVFFGLTIPAFGLVTAVFGITAAISVAVFFDFRIGVFAIMLLFPLSAARFMPSFSGLNPLNLAILGTASSYLISRFRKQPTYRLLDKNLLLLYLLPFGLACLVGARHANETIFLGPDSLATATFSGFLIYNFFKPLLMVVMAWLIAAAVQESKNPRKVLAVFFIGTLIPALFVVIYIPLSGVGLAQLANFRDFLSVLGLHANQFAVVLNFSIAVFLFSLKQAKGSFRLFLIVGLSIFLVALALTFSRGGYLGLCVTLICYFVLARRFWPILFGLLAIGIAIPVLPDAIIDRVTLGVTHGSYNQLSSGRLETIWAPIFPEFLNSPFLGHGLFYFGRSATVISGRALAVLQAHNAYLDLLLDIGIVGLAMVVGFFVTMFRDFKLLAISDPDPVFRGFFRGASIGLLATLVQAFFDDRLMPNTPQMFLWMAYGLLLGRHSRLSLVRGRK